MRGAPRKSKQAVRYGAGDPVRALFPATLILIKSCSGKIYKMCRTRIIVIPDGRL